MFNSKPSKIIAYIISSALLIFSLTISWITLSPVDVLRDWSQHTVAVGDNGQLVTFQEGDSVDIITTANKVMDIDGKRTVYIDCIQDGVETRYDVSTADVGRETGKKTSKIHFIIPYGISNLPQTCHFSTYIKYRIYGIRDFQESTKTNDFIVIKRVPIKTIVNNSTVTEIITTSPGVNEQNSTQSKSITSKSENTSNKKDDTLVDADGKQKICIPLLNICI